MKKSFFILLFFVLVQCAYSEKIKVRIFNKENVSALSLNAVKGAYDIVSENKVIFEVSAEKNNIILLDQNAIGIHLASGTQSIGTFSSLSFVGRNEACSMNIAIAGVPSSSGIYEDNLEITSDKNSFVVLNEIGIEKYVAAVLSAEIGFNAQPEFLKAKAIICRTYAIAGPGRHPNEGFLLCSDVHCQVYKGSKDVTPQIIHAVKATDGKLITDSLKNPIIAAFHSNCGGRTQNSEDGWTSYLPYLRSVTDSFCVHQPHAKWEIKIPMNKWKAYLASIPRSLSDTAKNSSKGGISYDQVFNDRQKFYVFGDKQIPMKKLRTDWNLKSSWFSITELEDSLLVQGRGYGHGVGLCQEGAMSMAEHGYSHEDIIHYYYSGVLISVK